MTANRIILLGPPGAGKGTQAERMCASHALTHLSTGDLLRAAVAAESDLGKQAKGFMDAGDLVPDALVVALVIERLDGGAASESQAAGFLLDGFPRNVAQAEALGEALGDGKIDCVVHMRLDDEEIVRRLLGRGRKDDNEPVIRNRLKVYRDETAPLIAYYEARGVLSTVDALGTMDEVEARIGAAIESAGCKEVS